MKVHCDVSGSDSIVFFSVMGYCTGFILSGTLTKVRSVSESGLYIGIMENYMVRWAYLRKLAGILLFCGAPLSKSANAKALQAQGGRRASLATGLQRET